jgi:hypothetical protein
VAGDDLHIQVRYFDCLPGQPNPVPQITKIPDDGYLALAYAKPSGYGSFLPSYYYSPDGWNWHEFTVD